MDSIVCVPSMYGILLKPMQSVHWVKITDYRFRRFGGGGADRKFLNLMSGIWEANADLHYLPVLFHLAILKSKSVTLHSLTKVNQDGLKSLLKSSCFITSEPSQFDEHFF